MSFNLHDNKPLNITLQTYEEYLLLYVDDELTLKEKTAVEYFAAQHPQVAEELEILLSTKINTGTILFENKESLLASAMKLNDVDETLLLYVDDELAGKEKEAIEKRIETIPELQLQYHLLLKTKLDKNEEIIYPYKKELYRSRKIEKPIYWLRVAAVALLIAGAGTVALWQNNNTQVRYTAYRQSPKNTNTTNQQKPFVPNKITSAQPSTELAEASKNVLSTEEKVVANKKAPAALMVKKVKEEAALNKNSQLAVVENKKVIDVPVTTPDIALSTPKNTQPENNFKAGVTTATTAAYNPVEASDKDFIDAVATSENKKGRAIRGFLRKATRFIERTTNIDPVNEDDKLLIGAVALKLK